MSDKSFTNSYGSFQVGDMVMISERVLDRDSLWNYVTKEHPVLELITIKDGTYGDGASVTLRSGDGRVTNGRCAWAIAPVEGLEGCGLCKSLCKAEEVCEFFESILEGRE